MTTTDEDDLERGNESLLAPALVADEEQLSSRMGIDLLECHADRVIGTMPVTGNLQPYGLLHGGANAVLAETLASCGAAAHAGPEHVAVGLELSCTHHRAATEGLVTGVATALHRGASTATYEVVITDQRGKRTCSARLTCVIRKQPPSAPALTATN